MLPLPGILALGLMPVVLLPAADFWEKHKPDEWTTAQVKLVITDSPWAKQSPARTHGAGSPETSDWRRNQKPNMAGEENNGGMAPANGRDPWTAGNLGPGESTSPSVVLRWDSATPVREACAKAAFERYAFSCYSRLMVLSGQADKFEELAKRFYILTLSNYPQTALPARDRHAPQHSAAAEAALERLGEHLKQVTSLKRKGKPSFGPEKVLVLPAGQALLVIAFFPRSTVLTEGDGNVAFESSDETVPVRLRFNLTKMSYGGRLEL